MSSQASIKGLKGSSFEDLSLFLGRGIPWDSQSFFAVRQSIPRVKPMSL